MKKKRKFIANQKNAKAAMKVFEDSKFLIRVLHWDIINILYGEDRYTHSEINVNSDIPSKKFVLHPEVNL